MCLYNILTQPDHQHAVGKSQSDESTESKLIRVGTEVCGAGRVREVDGQCTVPVRLAAAREPQRLCMGGFWQNKKDPSA